MENESSINDFVKAFKEVFPEAEYKATKDGQIHKSKGWLLKNEDVLYKEVTPYVPRKQAETMSYVRKRSKTVITSK